MAFELSPVTSAQAVNDEPGGNSLELNVKTPMSTSPTFPSVAIIINKHDQDSGNVIARA